MVKRHLFRQGFLSFLSFYAMAQFESPPFPENEDDYSYIKGLNYERAWQVYSANLERATAASNFLFQEGYELLPLKTSKVVEVLISNQLVQVTNKPVKFNEWHLRRAKQDLLEILQAPWVDPHIDPVSWYNQMGTFPPLLSISNLLEYAELTNDWLDLSVRAIGLGDPDSHYGWSGFIRIYTNLIMLPHNNFQDVFGHSNAWELCFEERSGYSTFIALLPDKWEEQNCYLTYLDESFPNYDVGSVNTFKYRESEPETHFEVSQGTIKKAAKPKAVHTITNFSREIFLYAVVGLANVPANSNVLFVTDGFSEGLNFLESRTLSSIETQAIFDVHGDISLSYPDHPPSEPDNVEPDFLISARGYGANFKGIIEFKDFKYMELE